MTMTNRTEFEQKFLIRVDDGPEQTIMVKTGVYRDAAAAVPAILGYYTPITVAIGVPERPDDEPFFFRIESDEFVGLRTVQLVRCNSEQEVREGK